MDNRISMLPPYSTDIEVEEEACIHAQLQRSCNTETKGPSIAGEHHSTEIVGSALSEVGVHCTADLYVITEGPCMCCPGLRAHLVLLWSACTASAGWLSSHQVSSR